MAGQGTPTVPATGRPNFAIPTRMSLIGELNLSDGWSIQTLESKSSKKKELLKDQCTNYGLPEYGPTSDLARRLKLALDEHFILQVQAECNRTLHLYQDANWTEKIWPPVSLKFGISAQVAEQIWKTICVNLDPKLPEYLEIVETLNSKLYPNPGEGRSQNPAGAQGGKVEPKGGERKEDGERKSSDVDKLTDQIGDATIKQE